MQGSLSAFRRLSIEQVVLADVQQQQAREEPHGLHVPHLRAQPPVRTGSAACSGNCHARCPASSTENLGSVSPVCHTSL